MMNGKRLFRVFLVFLCGCCVAGCRSTTLEQNENRVIGYREYELLVASGTSPGLVWSCGMNIRADVYAVKMEDTREWEAFGHSIGGFEYESGYEYRIRISESDYLDYTMATPAWTEYDLLEILSKEKKNSDGLPEHLFRSGSLNESAAGVGDGPVPVLTKEDEYGESMNNEADCMLRPGLRGVRCPQGHAVE